MKFVYMNVNYDIDDYVRLLKCAVIHHVIFTCYVGMSQ